MSYIGIDRHIIQLGQGHTNVDHVVGRDSSGISNLRGYGVRTGDLVHVYL